MKVLVVTGSRAFDVDDVPRAWAKHALVAAFAEHLPDLVAHGGARGPDTYADELAGWLGLPRATFSMGLGPTLLLPRGRGRPLKHADRYRYADPLGRNEAMMRWAADQAAEGHAVQVVGLIAPWSGTGGTSSALRHARALELATKETTAPSEAWPREDPAHEGQGGA